MDISCYNFKMFGNKSRFWFNLQIINMQNLFRWTIYLLIFFVISVIYYLYTWWSFQPEKKIDIASIVYKTAAII